MSPGKNDQQNFAESGLSQRGITRFILILRVALDAFAVQKNG
jgi:hypothetical protein